MVRPFQLSKSTGINCWLGRSKSAFRHRYGPSSVLAGFSSSHSNLRQPHAPNDDSQSTPRRPHSAPYHFDITRGWLLLATRARMSRVLALHWCDLIDRYYLPRQFSHRHVIGEILNDRTGFAFQDCLGYRRLIRLVCQHKSRAHRL